MLGLLKISIKKFAKSFGVAIGSEVDTIADISDYRPRVNLSKLTPGSLLTHSLNLYSQVGQDGIIAEILRRMNLSNGTFVEFGGWDGLHFSNCRRLYELGWKAIFIESDPDRYDIARSNYSGDQNALIINSAVGYISSDGSFVGEQLSVLLRDNSIDTSSVNVLSIDIDSFDLEVFESLVFCPDLIVLEGGMSYPFEISARAPKEAIELGFHHPLSCICSSAREKGYVAVCAFQDVFLVKDTYAGMFEHISDKQLYYDCLNYMTPSQKQRLFNVTRRHPVVARFILDNLPNYFIDSEQE